MATGYQPLLAPQHPVTRTHTHAHTHTHTRTLSLSLAPAPAPAHTLSLNRQQTRIHPMLTSVNKCHHRADLMCTSQLETDF